MRISLRCHRALKCKYNLRIGQYGSGVGGFASQCEFSISLSAECCHLEFQLCFIEKPKTVYKSETLFEPISETLVEPIIWHVI